MLLAPSKLRVAARIKLSTPSEMVIRILRQKVTTCDNHEDMTEMTILYIYIYPKPMRYQCVQHMVKQLVKQSIAVQNKIAAVQGSASTSGRDMVPQASPATICWKRVREAAKILLNPLAQRSHWWKSSRDVMGWKSSTEITAQKRITETSIMAPKMMAFMEEYSPVIKR